MLLNQIKANKSKILALGERYSAKNIRVFGSVARGEERPDSDVDFLVEFPLGYDLNSDATQLRDDVDHKTALFIW